MKYNQEKMERTTNKQKVGLIFLSFILTIIIIEIILRLSGFVILSMQQSENELDLDDNKTYRILTLGESTTANQYNGHSTWPAELEKKLNNNDQRITFRVFNEGQIGKNTDYILSKLEYNLEKYQPAMVITMIGINDWQLSPSLGRELKTKISLILNKIRTYKLFDMIWDVWTNKFMQDTSNKENNSFWKRIYYRNLESYKEIQSLIENGELQKAEIALKKIISETYNPNFYHILSEVYIGQNKTYKAETMLKEAIKRSVASPFEDNILNSYEKLRIFYLERNRMKESRELVNTMKDIRTRRDSFTILNYQELSDILKQKNIKHLAMQYPLLNINDLKDKLRNDKDIIFINNEDNFRKSLLSNNYNELFIDNFAQTFGHTTKKGNRLIAENVANVILEELNIE